MIFNVGADGGAAEQIKYDNSKSDLEANNLQGAVDEVVDSLGGFTPVIDETTGQITGYKTKVGADTVFPFSSGKVAMVTHVVDKNTTTFDIGFKPKKLIFTRGGYSSSGSTTATVMSIIYDEEYSDTKCWVYFDSNKTQYAINSNNNLTEITDTGFSVSASMVTYPYSYIAFG